MNISKKKTPAVAEPELTVKCGDATVTAKPGVMVLQSDTIRLTGDQPSNSFAHSPDLRERLGKPEVTKKHLYYAQKKAYKYAAEQKRKEAEE